MAFRLSNTCLVCASTSPLTNSLVRGSNGIWPDTQTVLPTRTACEYVPMAAGASVVEIICLLIGLQSCVSGYRSGFRRESQSNRCSNRLANPGRFRGTVGAASCTHCCADIVENHDRVVESLSSST